MHIKIAKSLGIKITFERGSHNTNWLCLMLYTPKRKQRLRFHDFALPANLKAIAAIFGKFDGEA